MTNKCVKELVGFINYYKAPTPPEDGNHLPKHVGVNLEYINKSNYFLDAFVGHFTTNNGKFVLVLSIDKLFKENFIFPNKCIGTERGIKNHI
jgi:hypothetical protein